MSAPDEIIHQSMRLKIMAALTTLPCGDGLEFTRLKTITGATDGNLGAHLDTLTKAGYVAIEKHSAGNRPQTRARATQAGRNAFAAHVAYLRSILDSTTD